MNLRKLTIALVLMVAMAFNVSAAGSHTLAELFETIVDTMVVVAMEIESEAAILGTAIVYLIALSLILAVIYKALDMLKILPKLENMSSKKK